MADETQKTAGPEIWVLAERQGKKWQTVTLELLDDAAALAKKAKWQIAAIVFAKSDDVTDKECEELAVHGANQVYLLENDRFCEPNGPLQYSTVLEDFFNNTKPKLLLAPSTSLWVECVSLLMARWNGVVLSDGVSFKLSSDGDLEVTRYVWRDEAQMTLSLGKDHPWCVCLRPNVAGVGRGNPRAKAEIIRRHVRVDDYGRIKVNELFSPDPSEIDLLEADRIVAGGRGVNGPEGFQLLEELANVLEAGVGASRVAVDLGWVPYSRQIGQTGKTVKPRLYMAIGISGASQHVDGMRESEVIIAINKDPNANIFKLCHLGFVGEAEPIVRALIEALDSKTDASKLVAASKGI